MAALTVWQRIKQSLWPSEPIVEPEVVKEPEWKIIPHDLSPLPIEQRRSGWRWVVRYSILKDGEIQDRGRTRFLREPDARTVQGVLDKMLSNWRQERDKGDMES